MDSVRDQDGPELEPGTPPIVLLKGITKTFPGVIANADIDLDVRRGEIHALLGENGAGKSTLMNVLTGIYRPDAGEIIIDGYAATLRLADRRDRRRHRHGPPAFQAGARLHRRGEHPSRLERDAAARASTVRARSADAAPCRRVQPRRPIPVRASSDLSAGEQQRVEILRVLARDARVLILDEPTAVLTPARGGRTVPRAPRRSATAATQSSSSATSSTRCSRSPIASPSCAAEEGRDREYRRLQSSHAGAADGRP